MKILIVKSIFVLNHDFIPKNHESIKSLVMCLKSIMDVFPIIRKMNITIDIKLCGWINNDLHDATMCEIRNIIDFFSKDNNNTVTYFFDIFDKNYGKIYTLKNIKKYINNTYQYDSILYSDHDIVFTDSFTIYFYSLIFRNINPIDNKFKMISLNQSGDPRHNPIINNKSITINNIEYYYSHDNIHIASGCFITDTDTISMLSQDLPDTKYVYGNEDILIGELLNKYQYIHLVSSQYHVFHPSDTDIEYGNWKKRCVIQYLLDRQNIL